MTKSAGKAISFNHLLLFIFLIGLFLRIFTVIVALKDDRHNPYNKLKGDAATYAALAVSILKGYGYSDCYESVVGDFFRDPGHIKPTEPIKPTAKKGIGYPLFLAAIFTVFGYHLTPVLLVQTLISALSALIVYSIGLRISSRATAGSLACIFTLFYYPLWYRAAMLMGETLLIFLILLFFYYLINWFMRPSIFTGFCTALLAGAVSLIKPIILPILPLYLLWAFFRARKQAKLKTFITGAIALTVGLILVIAPGVIRNYKYLHRLLLTPIYAGYQLIEVYNPYNLNFPVYRNDPGFITEDYPGFQDYLTKDLKIDSDSYANQILIEYLQDKAYMRGAIQFILHHPRFFLKALSQTFWNTWRPDYPDSRLLGRVNNLAGWGWVKTIPFLFCKINNLFLYLGMLPFFFFGIYIAVRKNNTPLLLIAVFFAYFAIAHSVFASMIRYRLTVMPLFFIISAFGLVDLWSRLRSFKGRI